MTEELTEAEWLRELRTTSVRQARGEWREGDEAFCCLGLACERDSRITWHGGDYRLNDRDISWKMTTHVGGVLSWMNADQADLCVEANDTMRMTFAEIADWWEAGQPVDAIVGAPERV